MDKFLHHTDGVALIIEQNCQDLYKKMHLLKVDALGLSEHGKAYFSGSHLKRLFFSIQTSAHILYNVVQLVNKPFHQIVLMDYGAGVGTLYLLAKMVGCSRVIYNDILEEWKQNALQIAAAINIDVDNYIVGDIDTTLQQLQVENISCDVITSRNVIEHIYQLPSFYACIAKLQPYAIVYSSTTANFYNPAMHLQHILLHKRVEKIYRQQRYQLISRLAPHLTEKQKLRLATYTQGYEKKGIQLQVEAYLQRGQLPKRNFFYTNTCDVEWGVWAENLLPFHLHAQAVQLANMQVVFKPGFWDTHYSSGVMNIFGKICNVCIATFGKKVGFFLAPFIYVIATPNLLHRNSTDGE